MFISAELFWNRSLSLAVLIPLSNLQKQTSMVNEFWTIIITGEMERYTILVAAFYYATGYENFIVNLSYE